MSLTRTCALTIDKGTLVIYHFSMCFSPLIKGRWLFSIAQCAMAIDKGIFVI
jgi:hypothetical protein